LTNLRENRLLRKKEIMTEKCKEKEKTQIKVYKNINKLGGT
jgi:hypothetical protein